MSITNQNIKRIGQQVGIYMEREFPSTLPNMALPAVERLAEHIVREILHDIKNDQTLTEARHASVQRIADTWGVEL